MNKEFLKEKRIHGNTKYPVSIYHMECLEYILDCHWHDEMEFLLVTDGKAIFQVGTNCYEVYAGQAIFINCGELHAGYQLHKASCKYDALVFHPDLLCSNEFDIIGEKYIFPVMEKKLTIPTYIRGDALWEKNVLHLISQVIEENNQKKYTYEMNTKAYIILLFSGILASHTPGIPYKSAVTGDYKVERLKMVLNHIHTNYQEKITLHQLSSILNMSNEHFCRYFKQMLKRTPMDYLNYYRVRKAAYLLQNSTDKVSCIASEVGFDSFSYFTSLFRHYMKCTPSKYRAKDY